MGEIRERTKFQGVYQRRSEVRRNPKDGRPDVCFHITYKNNGKKVWEKVGWRSEGYTAQMANDLRADRMQAIRHGMPLNERAEADSESAAKSMTLGEAWALYKEKWLPNLSKWEFEDLRYNKHIAPRFGDVPLDDIKPLDLESFKRDLVEAGLSPATIRQILGNIRRLYNKLVEWELYDGKIPTSTIKMPKIENSRVRYLTPKEAEAMLNLVKTKSITWWRISLISLKTGMRLNEILSLTWSDLDLSARVIHVRFSKKKVRMTPMPLSIKALFEEMPPDLPSALIFPSTTGDKSEQVSMSFKRAVEELGFNKGIKDARQKVVFHTLRHTFASWLAIDGVPLYTISELMGHSTMDMTKRYAHLCPDTKRAAVEKIDAISQEGRSLTS